MTEVGDHDKGEVTEVRPRGRKNVEKQVLGYVSLVTTKGNMDNLNIETGRDYGGRSLREGQRK